MRRVASLGMYDFPWLATKHDALWGALRGQLCRAGVADVPEALDRQRPVRAIWSDPALLLGQTCGYPLLTEFVHVLRVVATPVYEFPGCDDVLHRSFVVVREQDMAASAGALRGRRCAINGRDSNTGMNLLRALIAPLAGGQRFFGSVLETGAHLESLAAVREDRADVAAVDCVTYGLAARYRPDLLTGLRVLTQTEASPSLPFVTASGTTTADLNHVRAALRYAAAQPVARALGLVGVAILDIEAYAPVLAFERAAVMAGYPALA